MVAKNSKYPARIAELEHTILDMAKQIKSAASDEKRSAAQKMGAVFKLFAALNRGRQSQDHRRQFQAWFRLSHNTKGRTAACRCVPSA